MHAIVPAHAQSQSEDPLAPASRPMSDWHWGGNQTRHHVILANNPKRSLCVDDNLSDDHILLSRYIRLLSAAR